MLTTFATRFHPGWHGEGDPPAFWPVFPITFSLLWLAVLIGAFYLIRRRTPAAGAGDPMAGARSILAERFARGEIDDDEFLRRMAGLHGSS
ncbi:SHOCT domain-containing protein [Spirillospora albida]|uniref:SHOCT domain-containing protein n=1 Tax=Spirillospora albida TaxID=58123 RepID=UPI000A0147B0|nr:SHOCT domain-containing protein [Spirillospora albida]